MLYYAMSLVQSLFVNESRKLNIRGKYDMRICSSGCWDAVTVDDFFPCYPGGGPVYGRTHDNELWVLLLEKAYAKLLGSYSAMRSGWSYEAMIDLTGAPYTSIRFDDEDVQKKIIDGSLWGFIKMSDAMGNMLTATTQGEYTGTVGDIGTIGSGGGGWGGEGMIMDESTGLSPGCTYAILRARETVYGDKLLEIRNPWSRKGVEWVGDWSDKSPLWTEDLIVSYVMRCVIISYVT